MVDSAPSEVKWSYAEMLVGWDLIRYLISEQASVAKDAGLRDLLRKVAAAQWDEDERVKFSQVELDHEHLSDLFVDVPATRIRHPGQVEPRPYSGEGLFHSALVTPNLGGAAAYISDKSPYPFTLVRGAPGQGKSTLSQFVCQSFRAGFLPGQTAASSGLAKISEPRFPLRFDLADYAAWIEGYDVFDSSDVALAKGRRRTAAQATIESFLAELMTHASGRDAVTQAEVQELFARVPSIVVLDGLDEIGSANDRIRVVREINLFCARGKSYAVKPRVVVTTRPNSAGLPEPSEDTFEVISLSPLDAALRDQYLRKWCAVHGVRGNDSRTLRRNFNEKTREPYIGELAGNPMQLTILLYLLRQHGDAIPSQRTELYDAYMNLLLAREANKHPESVRKHRTDLAEVAPFLGWYMQSRAEEEGHSGRMSYDKVKAAMKHFQRTYGKPEGVVDDLFAAAADRLWALTSKMEGTFEFEVLSLREYFAARYLYRYAGEGTHGFDRTEVFRELLRRPYWLNTARFYGGNATGSDIYALEAGIRHELAENTSKHVRVAVSTLVTDGVFNSRPLEAASVVDVLTDDAGIELLLAAHDGREISPLPGSSNANLAWHRLTTAISNRPDDPQNHTRVRALRELLGLKSEFDSWWAIRLGEAIGTAAETAWLEIGAGCEAAAGRDIRLPGLAAKSGLHAQLILNTGLAPEVGGPLDGQLIRAVLDGQCSETTSVRSEAAQLAVALNPADFNVNEAGMHSYLTPASSGRRSQAMQQLRKAGSPYAAIAGLRRFRRGEKGSTFPWANTAAALAKHAGRCWLAIEIAVIGAASPLRSGYTLPSRAEAFGPTGHPAALIDQTRANRANSGWWLERLHACEDDLGHAEWALALWAVAEGNVIDELFNELARTIERTSEPFQRALLIASRRLSGSGCLDQREVAADSATGVLAEMLASRNTPRTVNWPPSRRADEPSPKPLAGVARRAKWLKVDQVAAYR